MKSIAVFIVSFLVICTTLNASTPPQNEIQGIVNAIKTMNANKLASYFASTIDLEVGDSDGSYSKTQAEIIFNDFFKKSPLKSFTLNHQGSSNDGSDYFIGTYLSNSHEYRVYVLIKKQDDGKKIQQIQFEED